MSADIRDKLANASEQYKAATLEYETRHREAAKTLVGAMKQAQEDGMTVAEIARTIGMSRQQVYRRLYGKSY